MGKLDASIPGTMDAPADWRVQDFSDVADRARFGAMVRERLPIVEINHDVEWLEAGRAPGDTVLVLAALRAGDLVGLMPLRVSSTDLEYKVGDISLIKTRVRQFSVAEGPLVAGGEGRAALAQAMDHLADIMPSEAVAFAGSVPCDSEFNNLLNAPDETLRARFHVLKWGEPNWHCKIDWAGSTQAYLASLGPDSRRNLKRYSKKLFADAELKPRVERFTSLEDVARFLEDGIKISDKTYQKKLFNLGLSRGGPTERRFRFAAARQSFLGHVLYLRDEPVAFHYGFVFGSTFFVLQMGYDPAYAQHQSGSVLFFHVLQDVEKLNMQIKTIDCLPGVTDFKLRTTNRKERTQSYYLFKRGLRGSALYAAIRFVDVAVKGGKAAADRLDLANALRRLLRRR